VLALARVLAIARRCLEHRACVALHCIALPRVALSCIVASWLALRCIVLP
jgi:hypothetical protein